MSASLKVLVPEDTINYIQNPSFRYDTTGWNAVGSTITRVLDHALYGIASLKVVTSGLAMREGVYYRVNTLTGVNEAVTISMYARGRGTVHLRLIEGLGKEWVSRPATLYSDRWTRMEVSGFLTGSNDVRLYVETDGNIQALTFYVDGAQMERKPYATTFCDGDQPGCRWNIVDSASNSSRDAYTRQGGRWVSLAGPCRENNDIYITVLGGMGMAPIVHNIQPWALSPGSYYQNTKVLDRQVSIIFHVKNISLRGIKDPNLSPLHQLRQQLIDLFKPDKTGGGEAFVFSYQEGEREMLVNMRYEAGLEGDWDLRNQWINSFPVRFLAVDPYFTENNLHSQALNFKDTITVSKIIAKVSGEWSNLGNGLLVSVLDIAVGKKGEIYVCGYFTKDKNNTITLNYIGYWDGGKWNALGTGLNSGASAIAVAPNGDIYVGGAFTTAGGGAANRIAKWNGSSWSALGVGLNGNVYDIEIDPNGNVYVAGDFTTAGGITARGVAKWDGVSWHSLGNGAGIGGTTPIATSVAISKDGSRIYFGGFFTKNFGAGSNDLMHVAYYDQNTNLLTQVGDGLGIDAVTNTADVKISPAGVLYAAGHFSVSGSVSLYNIARWNGSVWSDMGGGIPDLPTTGSVGISMDKNEKVLAAGYITRAGEISTDGIALWNGTSWTNFDIKSNFNNGYLSVPIIVGEDIYVCGTYPLVDPDPVYISSVNYITNHGTALVQPIVYIYGPGKLKWIENQSTKKQVYLNLDILDNEEVFIDFGKGSVWSTVRGEILFGLIQGSDFNDFSLVPGENKLAIFMTDDVDSLMYIYHQPRHWSADATVKAEEL